jgi:nucleoside-diphosphate-sugar epimerase
MKVAITGARGFIGKSLVEKHLKDNDEVRILSRKRIPQIKGAQTFIGDLANKSSDFYSFVDGVDILYHCAGEYNNKSLMQKLHIDGTQSLINSSKGRIGRWVQLSSVGVYGPHRTGVITENSAANPHGLYEETKAKSEEIVIKSGVPYVILRPSNVIGDSMPNQSIFQLIKIIKKGYFVYLGKKSSLANYVHVSDLVDALISCAKSHDSLGQVYNLSQTILIEEMVEAIMLGLNIDRKFMRIPELPVRLLVKICEKLPGFPLTVSRIDALTGESQYESKKITKELNFEFNAKLEEHFQLLAKLKSQ